MPYTRPIPDGTPPVARDPRRNCKGQPTNLFYHPDGPEHPDQTAQREHAAKAFCRRCPIRGACLQWAIDHHEKGIWGATNDHQRGKLRLYAATRQRITGLLTL
jgi:WhiB family redox-sensing transcriptional regulator